MKNLSGKNKKKFPGFLNFFSDSIDMNYFIEEENLENKMIYNPEKGYNEIDNLPAFATLRKKYPTLTTTNGRIRPAGYNNKGKWVPAKVIRTKQDRRAGK